MKLITIAWLFFKVVALFALITNTVLAIYHGYKIKVGKKGSGFYWSVTQKPIRRFLVKTKKGKNSC